MAYYAPAHKIKAYDGALMPYLQQWFSYNLVEINAWITNRIKQKTMGYINSQCSSLTCAILVKQVTEQLTTCLHLYSSPYCRTICQYMETGAQRYLHSTRFVAASICLGILVRIHTGTSFRNTLHNILSFPRHMFTYRISHITSRLNDWLHLMIILTNVSAPSPYPN